MNIANTFLLSSYSEEAVAAVGVSNQLLFFISMIFVIVNLGTAVVMSQNFGAGKKDHAEAATRVAIILNVGVGLAAGLLIFLFHRPLLTLMGLSGQVFQYAAAYFGTIGLFCALQGLNLSLANIMRNYGYARPPMMVLIGMNILNLIGNTLVITRPFGLPDFGIGGIAVWTVFSQAVAAAAMILAVHRTGIRLHLTRPFPFPVMKEILRVGIPGAGDNIAYSSANVCIMFLMTSLGTTALASYTLANNLIGFVQMSGYSVGQSAQIMVGRHVGAGDYQGAYRLGLRTTRLAMAMNLSVMVVVMILQRPILSLFTKNPEILAIVFWILVVDVILEFGRPFNLVIGCCIRGSGDVRWAIVASMMSIVFVLIPLAYVFTRVIPLGVPGVLIAYCIDEWLRGMLMTWRWRSRRWEQAALIKQTAPERVDVQAVMEAGS